MERDQERVARIRRALDDEGLDALVCTLPSNVLLVSGYWPVIGNAIAIATRDGTIAVLAPEDEEAFAQHGWADTVRTFSGGSLHSLTHLVEILERPLAGMISTLHLESAAVGIEGGAFDPSSYAATFRFGPAIEHLVRSASSRLAIRDARECFGVLRSVLTPREIATVRRACRIACEAYRDATGAIRPGMSEREIAAVLRSRLSDPGDERSDGFAYCMSGPNAARAYAAFQHSAPRQPGPGDGVLLHCNSYCGGFWTDLTRTFWRNPAPADQRRVFDAILEARRAALDAAGPGVRASEVDRAARDVMDRSGCGPLFKHGTGHGVGFAAIDHNARPRIHPRSDDVLEPGMIFNIEPAAYLPDAWGIRHCDMALVAGNGVECLTPFQDGLVEVD